MQSNPDSVKAMKRLSAPFLTGLAVLAAATLPASAALAHGTSSTSEGGGMALLIFPIAAILFVLFMVFMHQKKGWTVLVVGGAGDLGCVLVPKLLKAKQRVVVLDRYGHGDDVFQAYRAHENLTEIKGDVNDQQILEKALQGCDAVIDLAGVAAHAPLLDTINAAAVKRFIGAAPAPDSSIVTCSLRVADVCGADLRYGSDNAVGGMIKDAINSGRIRVSGDSQRHPVMHIDDVADLYIALLNQPDSRIDGKTYLADTDGLTLLELAGIVRAAVGDDLPIDVKPADDGVSDPVEYDDFREDLRFAPKHTIDDTVRDMVAAFRREPGPTTVDKSSRVDADPPGLRQPST